MTETITEQLKTAPAGAGGEWSDDHSGHLAFRRVVAERKALLSKRTLTYTADIRVDDATKEVTFAERLSEKGSGVFAGDAGAGPTPGWGWRTETTDTRRPRERRGTIVESSQLGGKKYEYTFDYAAFREAIGRIATAAGYEFHAQVGKPGA